MNTLYDPSMDNNPTTPFTMKDGGVVIIDVPKIHYEHPAVEDHFILFDQSDPRISLQPNGVFSFFHTIIPTEIELHECEKLFLTPELND